MSSPNLVILDSGAFSVWNQGHTIDLDDYIQFCADYSRCSYYVNLDVIPGKPGDGRSLTPENVENSCRQGWKNYLKMIRVLPEHKVIPVFHMGDSFDWLERYIKFGTQYIGISPANDKSTEEKLDWLRKVKPYIFNASGQPIIKTHGFAVTSFRLMLAMKWHSVDSASWTRSAMYGNIYVPKVRNGGFAFNEEPLLVNVSPKSPTKEEKQRHISTLSPLLKRQVEEYLLRLKIGIGQVEILPVDSGYKLQDGELWFDRSKQGRVMKTVEAGLATCLDRRLWANMKFLHKVNDAIDVDHIYFASWSGMHDNIEFKLRRRLFSYHVVRDSNKWKKILRRWEEQAGQPETRA